MKFPTPHFDKLTATLLNEKLPHDDKPLVEKALQDYHIWISDEATVLDQGYF